MSENRYSSLFSESTKKTHGCFLIAMIFFITAYSIYTLFNGGM